ncbi:MAG: PIG-L deacetylase family protein [Nanoarchaeota archaeon]
MKVLIIAAHPDDEVLGMGGTIKKLSKKKNEIQLCVVTEGATGQYSDKKMINVRRESCLKSSKILGISKVHFLDFPDMKLDSVPNLEINKKLEEIIKKFNPEIIYTTPKHDLNRDHKLVHESTLVVTRPTSSKVKQVYSYELPGFVNEPFAPNVYVNIVSEFEYKIKAFNCYKTEIEKFPHPRSIESLENLAAYRGIESGTRKSEAFRLIKLIQD